MARRRKPTATVKCHFPGCHDYALFEYDNQTSYAAGWKSRNDYLCSRHKSPQEVLGPENLRVEWTSAPVREESYGKFCGNSGFVFGPGFQFWPKDFPVGTRLRVTAEVLTEEGS